jgi:hypothetical protein
MRLTTSPPSHAKCHKIWEPKPLGTLIIIIIINIINFPSVDPYRITKSKWIWKSSQFGENKKETITRCISIIRLYTIFKVYA